MIPALGINKGATVPGVYGGIHEYDPRLQNDLVLWLDGSFGAMTSIGPNVPAANGDPVRRWINRANPGTLDANQATLGSQPLLSSGDRSLDFDGASDLMLSDLTFTGNNFCVVCIFTSTTASPFIRLLSFMDAAANDDWNNTTSFAINLDVSGTFIRVEHNSNNFAILPYVPGPHVLIFNSSSVTSQFYLDSAVDNMGFNVNSLDISQLYICGNRSGVTPGGFFPAAVKHVLVFSSPRTPAQVDKLQEWANTL